MRGARRNMTILPLSLERNGVGAILPVSDEFVRLNMCYLRVADVVLTCCEDYEIQRQALILQISHGHL
jgi:hypothetical protein